MLSCCKWRTDYRAVWRGNGNCVCRDADIFKRCTQTAPPRVGGRLPDGGSLRRASSAQKLSPRGRRTERQLAHSQGHENNCREAFPPIPSDKRRQFGSQSAEDPVRMAASGRIGFPLPGIFPHKQRRRGTPRWPAPVPVQVRHRPAVGSGIIHPEKGLENPLAERFRDAGSLVGNHDLEPFPIPVARDVYNAAGGLYLTAFSTRLHTACRSSSAFPARVQGAASTKMVMLRASA